MAHTFRDLARALLGPRGLGAAAGVVLDALYPPACRVCGEAVDAGSTACAQHVLPAPGLPGARCGRCVAALPRGILDGTACHACRVRPPAFARVHAGWEYKDPLRAWVLAWKHAARADLLPGLVAAWSEELVPRLQRSLARAGPGVTGLLVPVPAHPLRRLERGHDGTGRLAVELERVLSPGLVGLRRSPALARRRYTPEQGSDRAASREANVHGAFTLDVGPRAVAERVVWLVDDVLTSGATASECARVLRRHGARSVEVLCVARAGSREETRSALAGGRGSELGRALP